jgi:hypothetical protein
MMKTLALILSVALPGAILSADVAPAFATKMGGKCCVSSDGGRSYRYRMAALRGQIPHSCTAYAASCVRLSPSRSDRHPACYAAKTECLQTGTYVGPYSGRRFTDMRRI